MSRQRRRTGPTLIAVAAPVGCSKTLAPPAGTVSAPPVQVPAVVDPAMVVAIVNDEAITRDERDELTEAIAAARDERSGTADEDLRRESLAWLIDHRIQLQEANREKITVDDAELNEELSSSG